MARDSDFTRVITGGDVIQGCWVAYFQEPEGDLVSEAPLTMLIPTYALVLASVYFGIFTSPMLNAAREAAEMFLKAGGV